MQGRRQGGGGQIMPTTVLPAHPGFSDLAMGLKRTVWRENFTYLESLLISWSWKVMKYSSRLPWSDSILWKELFCLNHNGAKIFIKSDLKICSQIISRIQPTSLFEWQYGSLCIK